MPRHSGLLLWFPRTRPQCGAGGGALPGGAPHAAGARPGSRDLSEGEAWRRQAPWWNLLGRHLHIYIYIYIYIHIYRYYLILWFTVIYVLYLKLYHFWYIWIAIYHISMYNISHIVSINILCQVYIYIYLGNHPNIAQLDSDWWVTYSHSSDCGHGSEIGPTKLQLFVSSHPFDPFAGNILVRISGLFGDGKDFGHGTSPLNHGIYFIQWLKKLCRFQGPEA